MSLIFKNTLDVYEEKLMIELLHRLDKLRAIAIDFPTLVDQLNNKLPLFRTQVQGLCNFKIYVCNLLQIEHEVAELNLESTKSVLQYGAALKKGKELSLNIVLRVTDYEYYNRFPARFDILIFPDDFEHKPWEVQNCAVGKETCQFAKCITCLAKEHKSYLELDEKAGQQEVQHVAQQPTEQVERWLQDLVHEEVRKGVHEIQKEVEQTEQDIKKKVSE